MDGVVDLRFPLLGEADGLGVASPLEVEDPLVGPAVLVVTNEASASGPLRESSSPVPERPKKRAVVPSWSMLAEQCMGKTPFSGRR